MKALPSGILCFLTQANFLYVLGFFSFLSLLFAFGAQYYDHIVPCVLCYYERYFYGVLGAIGFFFSLWTFFKGKVLSQPFLFPLFILAGFVLVGGIGLGIYHLGVEEHWWQGTAACGGVQVEAQTLEDFREALFGKPMARCDEVNWRILGISATWWNLFFFSGWGILWSVVWRCTRRSHNC